MSSLTDSISLPVAPGVPETRIPRFGLGVYESEGEDCYNSVLWALEASNFFQLKSEVAHRADCLIIYSVLRYQAGYRLIE